MFTSSISGPFSEWNTKVPRIKSPKGLLLLGCFLSRFLGLLSLFLSHLYLHMLLQHPTLPNIIFLLSSSVHKDYFFANLTWSSTVKVFWSSRSWTNSFAISCPSLTYNAVHSKNLSPPLKTYLSPRRSRSSLIPSNSVFKSRSFSCSTSTWLSYWGWVLIWKDVIWPSWQAITETGLCQHLWLIIKIYPCYFTKWIPVNIQLNLVKSKGSTMESK